MRFVFELHEFKDARRSEPMIVILTLPMHGPTSIANVRSARIAWIPITRRKPLTAANLIFPHAGYGCGMSNKVNLNDLRRLAQVSIPQVLPWICNGRVGCGWYGSLLR